MIFSTKTRTDDGPKRATETNFEFLDRSAIEGSNCVRDLIEEALSWYPRDEVGSLITRIKSADGHGFQSANFELLIHEVLRRRGFTLKPHPELSNDRKTRPDFLVVGPAGEKFYLETVLASTRDMTPEYRDKVLGQPLEERPQGAESIKQRTLEALSEDPHPKFDVMLESKGDPRTQPSSKKLIREIHDWLDKLDPALLCEPAAFGNPDAPPKLHWKHEDWSLTITPHPIKEERRGLAKRMQSGSVEEPRWIDDRASLRRAVEKKSARYGRLDRALVVVINLNSPVLEAIDEVGALLGEEVWEEPVRRPDLKGGLLRLPNGAWMGRSGYKCRRASAVWFFQQLTPYRVAQCDNTLYYHPAPDHQAPDSLPALRHGRVVGAKIDYTDGIALGEALGLCSGWPRG